MTAIEVQRQESDVMFGVAHLIEASRLTLPADSPVRENLAEWSKKLATAARNRGGLRALALVKHAPPRASTQDASQRRDALGESLAAEREDKARRQHTGTSLRDIGIERAAYSALWRADIVTVDELRELSEGHLRAVPNLGPKRVAEILSALANYDAGETP